MTIFWCLFAVVAVIALCVRVLPENQRLAIVRSGRLAGVRGPGIVTIMPVIEKGVRIDLDREIHHWRSLSGHDLLLQIRMLVRL